MSRLRVWWPHILAYAFSVLVLASMSASYFWQVQRVWTEGTTKFDVISNCGILYFIQNEDWWRAERPMIFYGPSFSPSPVDTWVGMRIDRQTQFFGYTHASGEWMSPFVQATKETTFTAPHFSRDPGMYMSTTRVDVYAIPYWFFLVVPIAWILTYYFRKIRSFRRAKHPVGT